MLVMLSIRSIVDSWARLAASLRLVGLLFLIFNFRAGLHADCYSLTKKVKNGSVEFTDPRGTHRLPLPMKNGNVETSSCEEGHFSVDLVPDRMMIQGDLNSIVDFYTGKTVLNVKMEHFDFDGNGSAKFRKCGGSTAHNLVFAISPLHDKAGYSISVIGTCEFETDGK